MLTPRPVFRILTMFLLCGCVLASLPGCKTLDAFGEDVKTVKMPSFASADPVSEEFLLDGDCPRAQSVEELGAMFQFSPPGQTTDDALVSQIAITAVQSACNYAGDIMTVDMKVRFEGSMGPMAAAQGSSSYPFFVAVVQPDGKIMAKQVFSAILPSGGGGEQVVQEKMRQVIPVASRADGRKHKILVGFQLTRDQLEYNRAVIKRRRQEAAERAAEEEARRHGEAAAAKAAAVDAVQKENLDQ